jgi:hypothetical protein
VAVEHGLLGHADTARVPLALREVGDDVEVVDRGRPHIALARSTFRIAILRPIQADPHLFGAAIPVHELDLLAARGVVVVFEPVEIGGLHGGGHLQRAGIQHRGDDLRVDVVAEVDEPVVLAILGDRILREGILRRAGEGFVDRVIRGAQDQLRELLIDGSDVLARKAAQLRDLDAIGNGHGEVAVAFEDDSSHAAGRHRLHEVNRAGCERDRGGVARERHRLRQRHGRRGELPFLQAVVVSARLRRIGGMNRKRDDCKDSNCRKRRTKPHGSPC